MFVLTDLVHFWFLNWFFLLPSGSTLLQISSCLNIDRHYNWLFHRCRPILRELKEVGEDTQKCFINKEKGRKSLIMGSSRQRITNRLILMGLQHPPCQVGIYKVTWGSLTYIQPLSISIGQWWYDLKRVKSDDGQSSSVTLCRKWRWYLVIGKSFTVLFPLCLYMCVFIISLQASRWLCWKFGKCFCWRQKSQFLFFFFTL